MPTQMGKIAFPLVSFSTTMGMLLTGSIINPRIFISTSMGSPFLLDAGHGFAGQRIWAGARDPNIRKFSNQCFALSRTRMSGVGEIQGAVLCGPADPLTCGLIIPLHEGFLVVSNQFGIAADLDGALPLLHNRQAARFFFLGNVIVERERAGIGPAGILEAEQ